MRRRLMVPLVGIVVLAAASLGGTFAAGNAPALGLDLQGGASVVLAAPDGTPSGALDTSIEIIRNRVDALGVAEPDISRQGGNIVVELPGVRDQQRALDLVGQTAELRFRPVLGDLPPGGLENEAEGSTTTTSSTTTSTTTSETTTSSVPAEVDEAAPTTTETTTTSTSSPIPPELLEESQITPRDEDIADADVVLPELDDGEEVARYLLGPAQLFGDAVADARAEIPGGLEWQVAVDFTGDASDDFDQVAALCFNADPLCPTGRLAIVLDGIVQSAPTIQQPDFGGTAIISGDFSEGEAKDLALVLRFGALPVELTPETARTVSATLGEDSLEAGLLAGAIGTVAVLLYLILYYRALGLVVVFGLAVWAALQWSIISYLGATQGLALSLAGVTGIIVSVGVTVDSYVVYFERLNDEIRSGRTVRSSADRGFTRAFRTILAGNISALIGAVLLYFLTVGAVRGFAFFLGLATLLDIVVSWAYTRPAVALLSRRKIFTSNRFLGVARGVTPPAAPAGSRG